MTSNASNASATTSSYQSYRDHATSSECETVKEITDSKAKQLGSPSKKKKYKQKFSDL